jgi:acetyl esterase/lipase
MHLKFLPQQFKHKFLQLRESYQQFKIYDVGSYALNSLTPKKGYIFKSDIAYGLRSRQRFDLFRSAQPRPKRPLIVFVHGGAWLRGDKKEYRFIGEAFAKEGYDVVLMNYHLAPDHIFPSYVDDLQLLLAYLQKNAQQHAISPHNIILMGHSAGAFNVMSALYHPKSNDRINLQQIRAVVGLAGPYHFDYKDDPLCADAFDQSVPYQQVMPLYFTAKNDIKHYLFIAEKDTIVGHFNSLDLEKKLTSHGNHCQVIQIDKVGHITIVGSLSSLFSRFFATKAQILVALNEAVSSEQKAQ